MISLQAAPLDERELDEIKRRETMHECPVILRPVSVGHQPRTPPQHRCNQESLAGRQDAAEKVDGFRDRGTSSIMRCVQLVLVAW
jgi:hypothetical protein